MRRVAVAVACVLAPLALPGGATAGTLDATGFGAVQFTGAAGELNAITLTGTRGNAADSTFTITDANQVIDVDNADLALCAPDLANTVTCTGAFSQVSLMLGDMADTYNHAGSLGAFASGGPGNDEFRATTPPSGFAGFSGDEGEDKLFGSDGSEFFDGGPGADTGDAGGGDDIVNEVGGSGNDSIAGGAGNDTLEIDSEHVLADPFGLDSFTADLLAGTARRINYTPESDSLPGFEDFIAGDQTTTGAVTVTGTDGPNTIITDVGDDVIAPRAGADFIRTAGGNDNLNTVDGFGDIVFCGPGGDTVQLDQFDRPEACETTTLVVTRPAGADVVAPVCSVAGVRRSYALRAFLRGVRPAVTCDEAARLSLRLVVRVRGARGRRLLTARAGDLVLAQRDGTAGVGAVRLRPARKLVARLPRRRFRVRLEADARDEYGNKSRLSRTFRVNGKRKKR